MPTIEIDDELYAFIEGHASGFAATPNTVLRGLLGLDSVENSSTPGDSGPRRGFSPPRPGGPGRRGFPGGRPPRAPRRRRASLEKLVEAGLLKNGQKLLLRDFQGRPVPGAEAVVEDGRLNFRGRACAMSSLAGELLGQRGYTSPAFRGPRHWFTEDGQSILELWDAWRARRGEAQAEGE